MTGRDGAWLQRFESKGKDPQSVTAIEENQGLEMSVAHCRSGKNGEEWKWDRIDSTFSSLAEKYCKLSVLSEC